MIDRVKLILPANSQVRNMAIDWDNRTEHSDGHVSQSKKMDFGGVKRFWNGLLVDFNPSKFLYGDNMRNLSPEEIGGAIEMFSDDLNVDLKQAECRYLEIGLNVEVDEPASKYTGLVNGQSRKTTITAGTSKIFKGKCKKTVEMCLYDKIQEYRDKKWTIPEELQGKNLLRLELKLRGAISSRFGEKVYARTLNQESFLRKAKNMIIENYNRLEKMKIVELNAAKRGCTPTQLADDFILLHPILNAAQIDNYLCEVKDSGVLNRKGVYDLKKSLYGRLERQQFLLSGGNSSTLIEELDKKVLSLCS